MTKPSSVAALLVTAVLSIGVVDAWSQTGTGSTTAEEIQRRIEQLRVTGGIEIAGARIAYSDVLAKLYEERLFAPLWTDPATAGELDRALRDVATDGLDPRFYHASTIAVLAGMPISPALEAELDLLRSDALIRVTHDLRYGKVDGDDHAAGRRVERPVAGDDAVAALLDIVESGRVYERVLALRPTHFVYRGLVEALAEMRRIQASGGWEPIPAGTAIRPDSADVRVPALRRRLALSGDLAQSAVNGDPRVDAELVAAIRRFQHRHGLNEDGIVGPATLAELNVPVESRIDQIRINLERARWFTHDLPQTFVVANIAGAKVYMLRDGDIIHEARAIVGAAYTTTPVFSAPMRYIDLNPTWTVPPGIVGEVLANVRRDPNYLARNTIRVLDRSGRQVDPATIDFSRYTARNFPYVFRQDPGPLNPLGRIKFMFPNQHNVYLHDTPSRQLFEREQRTFSHGCIRVQDPLRLAELILDDPARWNRASLEAAIAEGKTRTIPLAQPLPVLVLYWTASADLHGELHFYRDVYGRDGPLLRALDRDSP